MSLKVSIEVPLHLAATIQKGYYDEIQLSRLVVDAVHALPMRLSATDASEDRDMADTVSEPEYIWTPGSSPENETFTLVETRAPRRTSATSAASPKSEEETFYVEVQITNQAGESQGHHFPPVKGSMTGLELLQQLEQASGIPLKKQRLLFNGRRIQHADQLDLVSPHYLWNRR